MQIQTESGLRLIDSVHLGSTIVSIAACDDYFAVGCLDDTVKVWKSYSSSLHEETFLEDTECLSGINGLSFMKNCTHLAASSFSSKVKIWDLDTKNLSVIDTPIMSAFKIIFAGDSLISCGDLGKLGFYDLFSKEVIKRVDIGESFLTAMEVSENQKRLVIGNVNGDAFLVNVEEKSKIAALKPHHKTIRSIAFSLDQTKIFTASDDFTIGISDLGNERFEQRLQGHIERVTCLRQDKQNPNILYSCSSDKTIRTWDSRSKGNVNTFTTQEPIWAIQIVGNQLFAGGETGELHLLSIA